jgi:hypothetical protein
MTLCPVAIVAGCAKCPIFKVCPAKGIIGDYKEKASEPPPSAKQSGSSGARSGKKARK